MLHTSIKLTIIFLLVLIQGVFAPNLRSDYSFTEIQAQLRKQYQIDQEIIYQKNLRHFKYALADKESANDWKNYNPYGYIGKFQFGKAALQSTGFGNIDFVDFMNNPSIFPEKDQEKAMDSLLRINQFILKDYINDYEGDFILDSIKITRTGLLAAAHLAGPGNVKKFLDTEGRYNPKDQLGTRLSDYLINFGAQFH